MNKEEIKKELEEIIDDETIICISEKGFGIHGATPDLLTLYTLLTKEMIKLKGNTKEILQHAFEMAFMSNDELLELFKKEMLEFVENLKIKEEDKKEEKEDKTTE